MTANEKVLEDKLFNLPYLEEKIQTLEKMVKVNSKQHTTIQTNLSISNSEWFNLTHSYLLLLT